MKTFVKGLMILALVGMIGLAFAQEKQAKRERKGKKGNNPAASMLKKVEALDLTAEQKEKIATIKKEHEPKLKEAAAKLDAALTPEQRKARNEAQKAGRAAGKKGKEIQSEVIAAMKLTDEQKKGYEAAQQQMQDAQRAFNRALAEVLSDEQEAKVGIKGGKKKKNT